MEAEGQGPEAKKRKFLQPPPRRTTTNYSPASKTLNNAAAAAATSATSLTVPGPHPQQAASASAGYFRIQQAKNFAVAQAQQDGCTGNFKTFDSEFGNFLVPVVPSRADQLTN